MKRLTGVGSKIHKISAKLFILNTIKNKFRVPSSLQTALSSLVTLGVYLPGKLWADNCLACSSTTATAMDPVIVMHISGTNLLSSPVNFIFCIFSQNSCSSSMSFSSVKVICQHVSSLKLLALPFLYSFHVDEISCSQFLKLDISNINT